MGYQSGKDKAPREKREGNHFIIKVLLSFFFQGSRVVYGRDVVFLLVGCLTSQQQASVSQGRICSDNFTCCHTEIQVADPTFYLTQSQYTDTGPTSPSADLITPGAWQGSHWSANFEVNGMTRPRRKIPAQAGFEPGTFRSRGGRLTTRPTRRSMVENVTRSTVRGGRGLLASQRPSNMLVYLSDGSAQTVIRAATLS